MTLRFTWINNNKCNKKFSRNIYKKSRPNAKLDYISALRSDDDIFLVFWECLFWHFLCCGWAWCCCQTIYSKSINTQINDIIYESKVPDRWRLNNRFGFCYDYHAGVFKINDKVYHLVKYALQLHELQAF